MPSTIELSFFFLHKQIEKLIILSKSRKKQYYIAPLLPAIAMGFAFYVLINNQLGNNWLICIYIIFFIISLIFTFLLTVSSVFFLNDKNIFEKSKFYHLLKQSNASFIRNKKTLKLSTGKIFCSKKRVEGINIEVIRLSQKAYPSNSMLFLNENCNNINDKKSIKSELLEETTKLENIVFNDKQLKMIEQAFLGLKKTVEYKKSIISDDVNLEAFTTTIKSLKSNDPPYIILELQSQECGIFLNNFFRPFVKILTNNELNLKQATKRIEFKIKDGYKRANYSSIARRDRWKSTDDQRKTYKNILDRIQQKSVDKLFKK